MKMPIRLYNDVIFSPTPDPANIRRLDMSVLPILQCMETTGIRIDRQHIKDLHVKLTDEMGNLQAEVTKLTGYDINLGSGDQLSDLLYTKLGLRQAGKEKWTQSKARLSADSDVLKAMISKHPAIPVILQWKVREKLRSTYTYNLIQEADEYDRIHCDFSYISTETGRLACKSPNLQTLPSRTKLGKEVRKAFIPSKGNIIGTIDAAQIEMRTMAVDAMCRGLLEIFWNWGDLYWGVSEAVYKREFTEDERKHGIDPGSGLSFKDYYRFSAKTTALGVTYAISELGLVDLFLSSEPPMIPFLTGGGTTWDYDRDYDAAVGRCRQTITDFFNAYFEILDRRREHHRRARVHGCSWDMFGRHRWIPQVHSQHNGVIGEGLRAAGNISGQGSAAGIVKLWMAVVWDRIQAKWGRYGIKPLLTVHDELCVEGPEGDAVPDFLAECAKILSNLIPYDLFPCPLESEWDTGPSYGDSK